MVSELGLVPGAQVYRLLVSLDDEDIVFAAPLFHQFKEARGQVGAAICRHAHDGVVRRVVLQGGFAVPTATLPTYGDGVAATPVIRWHDVAAWDGDVIARVLAQQQLSSPRGDTTLLHAVGHNGSNGKSNGAGNGHGNGNGRHGRYDPGRSSGEPPTPPPDPLPTPPPTARLPLSPVNRPSAPVATLQFPAAPAGSARHTAQTATRTSPAARLVRPLPASLRPAAPAPAPRPLPAPNHRPAAAAGAAPVPRPAPNGNGTKAAVAVAVVPAPAVPAPALAAATEASPTAAPAPSGAPEHAAVPRHRGSRYRRNGWRMAAAALLLIVAWVSITLVQSGGLPQLIRGVGASQPAVADEVPMRAPEGWRPGAASQAAARSAGQTGARVTSQPVVRPIPASRSGAFPNLDRP